MTEKTLKSSDENNKNKLKGAVCKKSKQCPKTTRK